MEPGTYPVLPAVSAAPVGHSFFASAGVGQAELRRAAALGLELGLPPHRVLLTHGLLTPRRYVEALAAMLHVTAVALPEHAMPDDVLIDATGQTPETVAAAVAAARANHLKPVLFAAAADRDVGASESLALATVAAAVHGLQSVSPVYSSGHRMWLWQYVMAALAFGAAIGLASAAPATAGVVALVGSAALFAVIVMLRLLVLAAALLLPPGAAFARPSPRRKWPLRDSDLPTYSVLVPLFREAAIVPDLIDALRDLDYPMAKLDIVLILEDADAATRRAVDRVPRPPNMRVIIVPDRQPRTKPKALNMALALTRGELVAVFDAEDVPAPRQLRDAAAAFAANPGRYACLQARLAIYNPRQSWLTRHFTLEYAALFHTLLPALVHWRLPLPLSGTSNHFPRAVLEAAAWDPFNVTEAADLGIRLLRLGGEVGLLDSETDEEAPFMFRQWLPQRTRWIKGWMQTYLVHTRQPLRLIRDIGPWSAFGFHALIGGFIASALAYPLLLAAVILEMTRSVPFATEPGSLHHVALTVAVVDFLAGMVAALVVLIIGARRAGLSSLAPHIALAPVYWLLISLAAYRALVQIVFRPHLWEKTEHSARPRRSASAKPRRPSNPQAGSVD